MFDVDESWAIRVLLRVVDDLLDEITDLKSIVDRSGIPGPCLKPEHSTVTSKDEHPNPFQQIVNEKEKQIDD